jgi:signal transduction histidine kinase
VAVFRRNRQWLRDYAEVENLVVNREQELKAAQQEILLSQKMKALGTLAAGVAHDFNNLLSVVRMANKSIHREANGQPEVLEGTNDIEEAVMEGKRLVQSMLGYSRNSAGPLGPYELSGVVEDTVALLTRQFLSGIELALDLDPAVPATIGSRGRLRQILLNLIVNASEAMNGHGTLRIGLKMGAPLTDGVLFLRPEPAASYAHLTVADSGPGVPPEILPRVFEPFFTTKNSGEQRGTGLGLSLVYALAEQEGMGIQVESMPGQGAVFHLFIPLRKSQTEIDTEYLSVTRPSPPAAESRRLTS